MDIGLALSGIGSVYGLLRGASAARRAAAARAQALRELGEELDREYRALIDRNRSALYGAAGAGGDALRALGSNLGAALAAGGVYNSSSVAGALAKQAADLQSGLLKLAGEQNLQERQLYSQNRARVAELGLSSANQNYALAREEQAAGAGGLAQFLGALSQYNLQRANAPNARQFGVVMNGNQNYTIPVIPSILNRPILDLRKYSLR